MLLLGGELGLAKHAREVSAVATGLSSGVRPAQCPRLHGSHGPDMIGSGESTAWQGPKPGEQRYCRRDVKCTNPFIRDGGLRISGSFNPVDDFVSVSKCA